MKSQNRVASINVKLAIWIVGLITFFPKISLAASLYVSRSSGSETNGTSSIQWQNLQLTYDGSNLGYSFDAKVYISDCPGCICQTLFWVDGTPARTCLRSGGRQTTFTHYEGSIGLAPSDLGASAHDIRLIFALCYNCDDALAGGCQAVSGIIGDISAVSPQDYAVDFEGDGETKGVYASGTVTLSRVQWNMTGSLIDTMTNGYNEVINGKRSARLREDGCMTMLEDLDNGLKNISFNYRQFHNDPQVDWKVEYSINQGVNWTQVGSSFVAESNDNIQIFSHSVDIEQPIRVRIKRATEPTSSNSIHRMDIDDIVMSGYGTGTNSSLDAGLVAWWPFNGNFNDQSGYENNGTNHGVSFTSDRYGNANAAAYFDGNSHYIEVPRSTSLEPQKLTVAAWVNPADMAHWQIVLGKRYAANTAPYNSYILDTTWSTPPLSWRFCTSPGGIQECTEGAAILTNQWSMLAGTDDGVTKRLYINGQLAAEEPSGVSMAYSAMSLYIGSVPTFGQAFKGKIDDVRIYSRALSSAEVLQLFQNGGDISSEISFQSVGQRSDGSGKIDLNYYLTIPFSGTASVSLSFSTNGGTTWSLAPQSGSFSGDYGSGISSGSRSITWNSTAQLPSSTFNNNFRARLVAAATSETNACISEPFLVDLRGLQGGLTVAGKVRNATTGQGLSGVAVNLAGQNTTTAIDGSYSFSNVILANGNTITASKSGFATYAYSVPAPAGTIQSVPLDIILSPASGTKPVVTHVSSRYENATFLAGIPIENTYRVGVDWASGTPKEIWVYVNGQFSKVVPASGPLTDVALNMGFGLWGSLRIDGNKIRFVARDTQGHESDPFDKSEKVIPLPSCLSQLLASGDQLFYDIVSWDNPKIKFEIPFPDPNIPSFAYPNKFPLIGRFGTDFRAQFGLEYELLTGNYELWAGLGSRDFNPSVSSIPKPKFFLGDNFSVNFGFDALARGYWSPYQAPIIDRVGARVYVDGEYLINTFYILDVAPGGQIFHILDVLNLVGVDINSVQQVNLYGLLKLEADATARLGVTPVRFDEITLAVKAGLKAAYEPDLVVAHCSIYAGGLLGLDIQLTDPIGPKKVSGEAFVGIKADAFGIRYLDSEFVVFNGTFWQREQSSLLRSAALLNDSGEQWICIPVKTDSARPMPRNYLSAGREGFALASTAVRVKSMRAADGTSLSPLDAFKLMKQVPTGGSGGLALLRKGGANSPQLMQAELPIITNAFPHSEPTLAGYGQELMLLWVADNANTNDLQYADIRWSRFDGTDWNAPTSIVTDTRADFAPKVAFDGNGDAVAVWQKVTDPNFTNANLEAMAAQMEIVWSRWDRTTGAWSAPSAMTTNTFYDGSPLLAGPLTNGDLLVTWTKNESNLLMGMGLAGTVENDVVLYSRWSAAGRTWSEPDILISNLAYRLSQGFAGVSNRAVYAWTTDADGVLTNDTDQEIFAKVWSNGIWSAVQRCTSNNVADKSVRAAVSPQDSIHLVWQSESNLVSSVNLSPNIQLVREDSSTAGFADYAMTYGPQGNMVVLWQEMTTNGSDAHYSVYDPISGTWSKDATFFNDSPLERSFSPVWDSAGQLNFAYNKVDIIITNETVELEGGGSVTVSNVPHQGRVDVAVAVRRLIADVAILPGDFTVEGANYLPGDAIELSTLLRNVGDVAVSNASIAFYEGDPSAGGNLITNVSWTGWLEGASTNAILSTVWVVPEPATNRTLFAVANPAHAFLEFTENNNTQMVSIGGADLSVSLISATAETNGSGRVIAQVQNIGAPGATNTMLSIRRQGQAGAPLASVEVPALDPGQLAQVALDLSEGTQPEGEALYSLKADDADVVFDIDTNNNTAAFAMNLWLDRDGDGIPDWWETEYFGGPTNAIASVMASNGVNTLLETYIAGLDPNDPHSYLIVDSVATMGADPSTGGFRLSWGSVSNRFYRISRASDLVEGQGFSPIAQHIQADPPVNTYLDTTASTNWGPFFYRIEVE